MAVLTSFFPGGVYPQDYPIGIPGFDYNPMPGELIDFGTSTLTNSSATNLTYEQANGLILKLSGTGFAFDDNDEATGGTVSKFELFQDDGSTIVNRITLSKVSLVTFMDAVGNFDAWGLVSWLLNRNDTLNGSAGEDDQFGGAGDDVLNGKAGGDFMTGGTGKDTYDGGDGFDTLNFSDGRGDPSALGGIAFDGLKGTVTDEYGNKETFKSIEGVRGTNFVDTMVGTNGDNSFQGLGGRDRIDGKKGFDVVAFHRDERNGGPGLGVFVDLDAGTAIDGFGRKDKLVSIEGARGTDYDDELKGSDAHNFLQGDAGSDTLAGGLGNDNLAGGDDGDFFVFDTALNEDNNVDTIEDFNESEDVIQLSLSIFTELDATGALDADNFAINDGGDATTEDQKILYSSSTGELFYDADGNGSDAKVLFAVLGSGLGVGAANFEII